MRINEFQRNIIYEYTVIHFFFAHIGTNPVQVINLILFSVYKKPIIHFLLHCCYDIKFKLVLE